MELYYILTLVVKQKILSIVLVFFFFLFMKMIYAVNYDQSETQFLQLKYSRYCNLTVTGLIMLVCLEKIISVTVHKFRFI